VIFGDGTVILTPAQKIEAGQLMGIPGWMAIALCLSAVPPLTADTVISTVNTYGGWDGVESNLNAAEASWIQTGTFVNVSITAQIVPAGPNATGTFSFTGTAYLMTKVGPGTTSSYEVARAAFSAGGTVGQSISVALFAGLTLGPGKYYLVLGQAPGQWSGLSGYNAVDFGWAFTGHNTPTTAPGVTEADTHVNSFPPASLTAVYPPASSFKANDPSTVLQYSVSGITVPDFTALGPVGVSTRSVSSNFQNVAFTFHDPKGYQDLGVVNILINNFLDGRRACYLAYSRPSNLLYLVGDDGGTLSQGSVLTSAGLVSNSQCQVSWTSTPVAASGDNLTLTVSILFFPAFSGNKVTYLAARDVVENNSGWQPLGTWQVPGGATGTSTAVVGVNPAGGIGSAATPFTFTFGDTKGPQDLGVVNILVNNFLDGRHACYLAYARASNALYLVDDTGDAGGPYAGSAVLSSSGTIQNSQCTVSWNNTPTSTSGNNLTLTLGIAFQVSFGGNRVFYLAARDATGLNNTDWQAIGTWTVQ